MPLMDGWQFTGRIDARVMWGTPKILDFKTTGTPWTPGDQHGKEQATAYLLADRLARRKEPAQRVTFAIFATVPRGSEYACHPMYLATERSESELVAFGKHLQFTASKLASETDFYRAGSAQAFLPKTGPLCNWCEVKHACAPGRAWLDGPQGLAWFKKSGKPRLPMLPIVETAG